MNSAPIDINNIKYIKTTVYNKPSDKELSKQPHKNGKNDMFKKKLLPTRQMTEASNMLAVFVAQ